MTQPRDFNVWVAQNPYLLPGDQRMDAVITVSASGSPESPPTVAQVIMIDCSGSMDGTKLLEAVRAALAALDTMRDGVTFAIVAGTDEATMVYPRTRRMVAATAETPAAAPRSVPGSS
jgi:hypothetical protein